MDRAARVREVNEEGKESGKEVKFSITTIALY